MKNYYPLIPSSKEVITFLLFFAMFNVSAQTVTLWSENFDSYANNAISGNASGASSSGWTSQAGASVQSGLISATQTNANGSDLANPLEWRTNTINISSYTNVQFSVSVNAFNQNEFEDSGSAQDQFSLQYRINGGSWVTVVVGSGSAGNPVTGFSQPVNVPNGTTLEIKATFHNTANNETYTIDNVLVTGEALEVDTDGDGVPDNVDLDDDNDGILDVNEQACDESQTSNPTSGSGVYRESIYIFDWASTSLSDGIQNGDTHTFTLINGIQATFTFSNVSNTTAGSTYVPTDLNTWSGSIIYQLYDTDGMSEALYGANAQDVSFDVAVNVTKNGLPFPFDLLTIDSEATNGSGELITFTTDGEAFQVLEEYNGGGVWTGEGTNTITALNTESSGGNTIFYTTNPSNINVSIDAGGRQGIAFGLYLRYCDSNESGIPDYLNTDSDGDGCPDAIEASENVLQSHLLPNGSIDISSTGGVDSNGVPNLVNNGGSADVDSAQGQSSNAGVKTASTITIDSDLTVNTPLCEGENAEFDFSATGIDEGNPVQNWVYQLQKQNGSNWDSIGTLGTLTNGVSESKTIVLNNVQATDSGVFRVIFTNSNNSCEHISQEVSLMVKSKPTPPTINVVDNCDGTSTLTASNYTGVLLWSNGETTESITVNTVNTYTITQTIDGCESDAASANSIIRCATVTIGDVTVSEGDNAIVPVTLSNPSTEDITVEVTVDGVVYTVTITAGATTGSVTVPTTEDTISGEADEVFAATGVVTSGTTTGAVTEGSITVQDDDSAPTVTIGDVTVSE
ncbi:CshA/CshB family fibrillar adhesin-related protein, partial [Tenacibaculum sp. IB213877]|uniref:CshA/CshB family fibrillar adhesin-related protein n=1 Tax=Tenacibaculum sp. IB213877 TaxID=3097351 RepID=UPI002A5A9C28